MDFPALWRRLRAVFGPAAEDRFLDGRFRNQFGQREYKLFVPRGYHGKPAPLVVMLHGCSQSPEDFAAGTGMNAAAGAMGWLVVYPGQTKTANVAKCWNWFEPRDQMRDSGEPSLIAGITRKVMREFQVDADRVYIAGLSAGGAAACIMAANYPELYAAVGVHSGLACGAAQNLGMAVIAMKSGYSLPSIHPQITRPTIVFHGDADHVVNPRNGDAVVRQALPPGAVETLEEEGQVPGGHGWRRQVLGDHVEQWVVHGAGHAWSGGKSAGSFTDPLGPDATGEMLRFFKDHPRTA